MGEESEEEKKAWEELCADFEPLSKLMKEILGDKVEKVVMSERVTESPSSWLRASTAGPPTWSASCAPRPSATTRFLLHGVEEDDGDQPEALDHEGAQGEGRRRQGRQDGQGPRPPPLRDVAPHLGLLARLSRA